MSIWSGYLQPLPEELVELTSKLDSEIEWTYVNPEASGPPDQMINYDFDLLIKELVRKDSNV